jgi:hypothetical protein
MIAKATWSSKEYDIPVKIVEYLGERHGEHWFLVESKTGRTGVPRSQLKNIDWRTKSENSC